MLSLAKLTMPAANRNPSSRTISTRCFSAKATMWFMTDSGEASRSVAGGGAIDKQRARSHDLFPGGEPVQYLDHAAAGLADADHARDDRAIVARDPNPRGVALVDDRGLGHRGGVARRPGDDAEAREHQRLQGIIGVLDIGPHRQAVGVGVHRRRDPRDPRLKNTLGKS